MYRTRTIAVDHGNRNMKTEHQVFTSGLVESETEPPMEIFCITTGSITPSRTRGFLT